MGIEEENESFRRSMDTTEALEAAGLLKPGRALSILDTPIEPKELP